jgi:hypothetical protein
MLRWLTIWTRSLGSFTVRICGSADNRSVCNHQFPWLQGLLGGAVHKVCQSMLPGVPHLGSALGQARLCCRFTCFRSQIRLWQGRGRAEMPVMSSETPLAPIFSRTQMYFHSLPGVRGLRPPALANHLGLGAHSPTTSVHAAE